MKGVFVDTGGWFAAVAKRDHDHHSAAAFLRNWRGKLLTTDYVLDETLTLIRARIDHDTAIRFLESFQASPSIELVFVAESDFHNAADLFSKRSDKQWSFTDCTSFTVMERLGLRQALAFDAHFAQAGFERV